MRGLYIAVIKISLLEITANDSCICHRELFGTGVGGHAGPHYKGKITHDIAELAYLFHGSSFAGAFACDSNGIAAAHTDAEVIFQCTAGTVRLILETYAANDKTAVTCPPFGNGLAKGGILFGRKMPG